MSLSHSRSQGQDQFAPNGEKVEPKFRVTPYKAEGS